MIIKVLTGLFYTISSAIQRFFHRTKSVLKSKFRWLIRGLIVATISFVICNRFMYVYNTKIRDQIIVLPNKINLLTATDWDITKVFGIKNRNAEQSFFSIWLKLYIKDRRLDFNDIEITTEKDETFISEKVMDISVNFDVLKLQGFDAQKRPCIYLLLYSLWDNESKFFKVKKRHSIQDVKEPIELLLEVKDYSKTPAQISSRSAGTALSIQPPESFTVESFSILIKKNP